MVVRLDTDKATHKVDILSVARGIEYTNFLSSAYISFYLIDRGQQTDLNVY